MLFSNFFFCLITCLGYLPMIPYIDMPLSFLLMHSIVFSLFIQWSLVFMFPLHSLIPLSLPHFHP